MSRRTRHVICSAPRPERSRTSSPGRGATRRTCPAGWSRVKTGAERCSSVVRPSPERVAISSARSDDDDDGADGDRALGARPEAAPDQLRRGRPVLGQHQARRRFLARGHASEPSRARRACAAPRPPVGGAVRLALRRPARAPAGRLAVALERPQGGQGVVAGQIQVLAVGDDGVVGALVAAEHDGARCGSRGRSCAGGRGRRSRRRGRSPSPSPRSGRRRCRIQRTRPVRARERVEAAVVGADEHRRPAPTADRRGRVDVAPGRRATTRGGRCGSSTPTRAPTGCRGTPGGPRRPRSRRSAPPRRSTTRGGRWTRARPARARRSRRRTACRGRASGCP